MRLFLAYLVDRDSPPPLVISISYGADEKLYSTDEKNLFNANAIKLGALGVTIVAASGDDGVNTYLARSYLSSSSKCGYVSMYPGSSPYVNPPVAHRYIYGRDFEDVLLSPHKHLSRRYMCSACSVSRITCRRLSVNTTEEEALQVGAVSLLSTRNYLGKKKRLRNISLKSVAVTARRLREWPWLPRPVSTNFQLPDSHCWFAGCGRRHLRVFSSVGCYDVFGKRGTIQGWRQTHRLDPSNPLL